ncbi:lytic transglycosylase domain-containing protein [Sphingomonas sanxanigenens]|uniref:Transglycosylase SLT domain-containing protein n=1 Tax=Sphingomonas sanxanigenens DSM 19645 = NX02 TaxID=1123269 RepID=W0A9E6_9SPHN|nr:lytic transglycosylase domain-containing protein [Sphingomonas sanxanigenens]AHE53097.1 hypothetical protein NX02_06835 [Sphingomonas sanxanigenens DSM 19645 = NX02]
MLARLAIGVALAAATASPALAQTLSPEQRGWYRARLGVGGALSPSSTVRTDPLAEAVVEWSRLSGNDSASFEQIAAFLMAHPGWPGQDEMRRTAERAIRADSYSPIRVAGFFRRFPPLTAIGHARNADALAATGDRTGAAQAARAAWAAGVLPTVDEARLIAAHSSAFTPLDYDARVETLLWARRPADAARVVSLTSSTRRPLFEARIAMLANAPDAAARSSAMLGTGRGDAGFIADRARWLLAGNQFPAARAWLAQPRTLTSRPANVETWYEALLLHARAAARDGQNMTAFDIARQIDDAYAPGVAVRDRPLGERDDYTSLAWLAGQTALEKLGRPGDAIAMFERYALAARSPQTQSKGYYWAGRAAQAAGRGSDATRYYTLAAAHYDQFYGQLSSERLGRPITVPQVPPPVVAPALRDSWMNQEPVRAAVLLGELGARQQQTRFVRAIAQDAKTEADHVFAAELAIRMGRPDLGVMIGRSARLNGFDMPQTGFPRMTVPVAYQSNWTIIHAITRQESQFDREAMSHAGARGLMQLMPGTARETSARIGVGYRLDGLTSDPDYNVSLGATYIQRMLDYYGGSYVLAVAAYNAGPGNVNKWLRANGDPRTGSVDVLDWIEAIPLTETRGYVQRVLENAVVYDQMRPTTTSRPRAPLSYYLGKPGRPG